MNILVTNVHKSYFLNAHEVPVLHGINLAIAEGELITLTGPSGAGKSTLLHILGTLDLPSKGDVTYDNINILARKPAEVAEFRNRNIGFVFQFHHLLPEFSALENIALPLRVGRRADALARRSAEEWLVRVGLGDRLHHKPGELSGGEQQRVALARALVGSPRLLLADEPTGNLDEKTGEGIVEIIKDVNKTHRITSLIITHNPRLAQIAPRRLHLTKEGLHD